MLNRPGIPRRLRGEVAGFPPSCAAKGAGSWAFWTVAVIAFGVVERLIDPKTFHTVWLGMWWAVETVTTVGYGDIVPSQTAGKVIAGFLMLGGLSLLAVVTAAITSGFVASTQRAGQPADQDRVMRRLDELGAQLEAVQTELERLRGSNGTGSGG